MKSVSRHSHGEKDVSFPATGQGGIIIRCGTLIVIFCLGNQYLCSQNFRYLDKPKVAGIPMISYNKSFGGIFGAMGGVFFSINKLRDTISPASSVGAAAIFTTNKTWF